MGVYFEVHNIEFNNTVPSDHYCNVSRKDLNQPLLMKATFGSDHTKPFNVTPIIRYILWKQGNIHLKLRRPKSCKEQYWYIYLFGDPSFKQTKILKITSRRKNGVIKTKLFCEDDEVAMALRL